MRDQHSQVGCKARCLCLPRWANSRPKASAGGKALPNSTAPNCSKPYAALHSKAFAMRVVAVDTGVSALLCATSR